MKNLAHVFALSLTLLTSQPLVCAAALDAPSNPATEKFQQDLKAAVFNGSITIPQVKQLQADSATLKSAREAQTPGAPVDMLTPYRAVSSMKAVMATVKSPDRETLQQDLTVVMANQQTPGPSAAPSSPGKKLGKDVFTAVMHGNPTEAQVRQLQDSLNSLQAIGQDQGPKLRAVMTLKKSKSDIEQVMNAGSFRPQDRQAVLDDLNDLGGEQGGGMRRGVS